MNDQTNIAPRDDRQVSPLVAFKRNMNRLMEAGEFSALPDSVSPEAFRNAAIVAFQDNPDIGRCTPESVFRSLRKLAGMGLVPDNREAAVVPFKGQATAMPMVYGLYKLALNSGTVKSVRTVVVYEGEDFTMDYTTGEAVIRHDFDPFDRGDKFRGVYAVAKMADGRIEVETMGKKEVEKRRMASATQKDAKNPSGIWRDWYEEMAEKTVLRKLMKRLPMSPQDRRVIEADDEPTMREINPTESRPNAAAHLRAAQPEPEPTDNEAPVDLDGNHDPVTGEVLDPETDEPTEQEQPKAQDSPTTKFITQPEAEDVMRKVRGALDAGTDPDSVAKFYAEDLARAQDHQAATYDKILNEIDDARAAAQQ